MPVIIRTKTNWIILSKEILATGHADGNNKGQFNQRKIMQDPVEWKSRIGQT